MNNRRGPGKQMSVEQAKDFTGTLTKLLNYISIKFNGII